MYTENYLSRSTQQHKKQVLEIKSTTTSKYRFWRLKSEDFFSSLTKYTQYIKTKK